MNLRNVAFVASAVVGLTATMAAEQAAPSSHKAPAKTQAKSVSITGCVAQGIDADHYVLVNAVRREQPPSSSAVAGTSGKVGSDKAGANDRTGSYDLQGGEFKAHLGHKIEVTGTSGSTGKTSDATTSASAPERKPLPRFNVQSVKMVSATCS
jgi:membrane-bound ClpP family serine protease